MKQFVGQKFKNLFLAQLRLAFAQLGLYLLAQLNAACLSWAGLCLAQLVRM